MKRLIVLAFAAIALAACAPLSQRVQLPPPGFAGPHFEPDALVSFDGDRLPMDVWAAHDAAGQPVEPRAVIIALHGMNDYADAFHIEGPIWARQGITTYAYDQRGFGRGPRRGVWGGEKLMVEDLRTAVFLARAQHPHAVITVLGHSMGGAVAILAFASENPPDADRLILAAPAVWGWSSQPLLNKVSLWVAAHVDPKRRLVPPRMVTDHIWASDNIDELRRMGRDPNLLAATRIDAVYGLVNLMSHASADIGKLKASTLYLYGAHDQIIPKAAAFDAVSRLPPGDRSIYYPKGWHLLLRDLDGALVRNDIEAFIRDPKATPPSGLGPVPSTGR
jgi:acylglycerol lipase